MDAVAGPSAPPLLPPGGLFEIVFSFDTTGSMSRVIDEVKGRLQDMIQRLQADIPGIRFGVIAHGDYCDKDVFYLEKHVNLTSDLVELTNFVQDIEGTGGGDPEECYEYILWMARGYNWTPGSRRALVVIGDSVPHDADYELNTQNLDWKEQLNELINMGVKVYGVQAFDEESASEFYSTLATTSQGEHLKLGEFSNICDFFMAICYRERGDDFLEGFEAEVRAREARLGKDLEGLFGALRRGDSSVSGSGSLVKTPSSVSNMNFTSHVKPMVRKLSSLSSTTSSASSAKMAVVKPIQAAKSIKTQRMRNGTKTNTTKPVKCVTHTIPISNNKVPKSKIIDAKYRHLVPETEFILNQRNLSSRWSSWKLAMTSEDRSLKKTWETRKDKSGFRKKCLFPKSPCHNRALFEIAVQRSKGCKLYVMQAKWATIAQTGSWEHKLIKQTTEKDSVETVLKNGGKIFVRRFRPKRLGRVQKTLVQSYRKSRQYQYAWSSGIPKALAWAM